MAARIKSAAATIASTILHTFVVTRVQSGLTKFVRTTLISVTVPVSSQATLGVLTIVVGAVVVGTARMIVTILIVPTTLLLRLALVWA